MSTDAAFPDNPFPQMTSPQRGGNKRKRGPTESPAGNRASPMTRRSQYQGQIHDDTGLMPTASMSDNAATFLQGNRPDYNLPNLAPNPHTGGHSGESSNMDTAARALNYSMQVPTHPTDTFIAEQGGAGEGDHSTYTNVDDGSGAFDPMSAGGEGDLDAGATDPNKPSIGSDEWTRLRKDNHKEVERRRRETINEGINEIAKIVPGCEKNKGSILARAVSYITKLHDEASQNIDKWTFEKLVTEQAINDLSGKLHRAWAEKEEWKRIAKEAGVDVDNVDLSINVDDEDKDEDEDDSGEADEPDKVEAQANDEDEIGGEDITVDQPQEAIV